MIKTIFLIFTVHNSNEKEAPQMMRLVRMIRAAPLNFKHATLFTTKNSVCSFSSTNYNIKERRLSTNYNEKESTYELINFIQNETREPAGTKYVVYITGHSWMFYLRIRGALTCRGASCKKNIVTFDYISDIFKRCKFSPDIMILDSCLTSSYEILKSIHANVSGYIVTHQSHAYTKGILCLRFLKMMAHTKTISMHALALKIARLYYDLVAHETYPQDVAVIDAQKAAVLLKFLKTINFKKFRYDKKHALFVDWNVYDLYTALMPVLTHTNMADYFKFLFTNTVIKYLNNRWHTSRQQAKRGISFILKNSKKYAEDVLYPEE